VIEAGSDAYCWGQGGNGRLGNNDTIDQHTPVLVSGGLSWSTVGVGDDFTCGLTTAGAAYCWGYGSLLGDGTNNDSSVPVPVAGAGGHTFSSINAGDSFTCGIDASTKAGWCWGNDGQEMLGDNDYVDKSTPVAVGGGLQFVSITGGNQHDCGVTTTGTGYCWG